MNEHAHCFAAVGTAAPAGCLAAGVAVLVLLWGMSDRLRLLMLTLLLLWLLVGGALRVAGNADVG